MTTSAFVYDYLRPIIQVENRFPAQYRHLMSHSCGAAVARVVHNGQSRCIFFLANEAKKFVHTLEFDPSFYQPNPTDSSGVCGEKVLMILVEQNLLDDIVPSQKEKENWDVLNWIQDFRELVESRVQDLKDLAEKKQELMANFMLTVNQFLPTVAIQMPEVFDLIPVGTGEVFVGVDSQGKFVLNIRLDVSPKPVEVIEEPVFVPDEILDRTDDLGEIPPDYEVGSDFLDFIHWSPNDLDGPE